MRWLVMLVMVVLLLAGCQRPTTYDHAGVVESVKYERATFSDSSYTTVLFKDGTIIRVVGTLNGIQIGQRYRIRILVEYIRVTTLYGARFWRCVDIGALR